MGGICGCAINMADSGLLGSIRQGGEEDGVHEAGVHVCVCVERAVQHVVIMHTPCLDLLSIDREGGMSRHDDDGDLYADRRPI